MKKYSKPSMEIVDLRVEEKITAPTTYYVKGVNVLTGTISVGKTSVPTDTITGANVSF